MNSFLKLLYSLLIAFWVTAIFNFSLADEIKSLELANGDEIQAKVYSAEGTSLLLVLPSEHGLTPGLHDLASELSNKGVEVWIADPFTTWFLPTVASSLDEIPREAYAQLIAKAVETKKDIFLLSNDKGSIVLLEAARQWQLSSSNSLSGIILISPNLYINTPLSGSNAEFSPIAHATNFPVFIIVPEKSVLALRLANILDVLNQGGSDLFSQVLADVRDRFFFRPDYTVTEQETASRLSAIIIRSMKLLRTLPAKRSVAKLEAHKKTTKRKTTGSLAKYTGSLTPDDFTLRDLEGKHHSLSQYRGQVVIVNFWASWCPPCVHEIPSMSKLQSDMKNRPFKILAINLGEKLEDINNFLAKRPVNFPVLLDPDQLLPKRWKVFAFPTSYIVDKKGNIRFSVAGGIDWNTENVTNTINSLMAEN